MKTTERIVLFLVACMSVRLLFAYVAKIINTTLLRYMGYVILILSLGMFYSYATMKLPGVGAFGGTNWWNNLRPLHGVLYLLFSYHAIQGHTYAWMYLAIDALIGFTIFVIHYGLYYLDK